MGKSHQTEQMQNLLHGQQQSPSKRGFTLPINKADHEQKPDESYQYSQNQDNENNKKTRKGSKAGSRFHKEETMTIDQLKKLLVKHKTIKSEDSQGDKNHPLKIVPQGGAEDDARSDDYCNKNAVAYKNLTPEQKKQHVQNLWKDAYLKARAGASVIAFWQDSVDQIYKFGLSKKLQIIQKEEIPPKNVILPNSRVKSTQSIVMILLLMYTATYMPYKTAFLDGAQPFSDNLDWLIDALFILDVLLTFFTAYENQDGVMVCDLKTIATHYLKTWFLFDIAPCIPFQDLKMSNAKNSNSSRYQKLLRLMRLPRLYRLVKIFKLMKAVKTENLSRSTKKLIQKLKMNTAIMRMVWGLMTSILVTHLFACLWFLIARFNDENPNTWVYKTNLRDAEPSYQYARSLYWAFTVLVTVGYGDVPVYTSGEMIISIIWMIFGVGFYAFNVGNFSSIISSNSHIQASIQYKIKQLAELTKKAQIPIEMSKKIRKFIENNIEALYNQGDEAQIIKMLPPSLRDEVLTNTYGETIEQIQFFKELTDPDFLWKILPILKPMKLEKQDVLYWRGDHAEEIYFIKRGHIKLYTESGYPYVSYGEGDMFGDSDTLLDLPRDGKAIATTHLKLLVLRKDLFERFFNSYQENCFKMIMNARSKRDHHLKLIDEANKKSRNQLLPQPPAYKAHLSNIPEEKSSPPLVKQPTNMFNNIRKKFGSLYNNQNTINKSDNDQQQNKEQKDDSSPHKSSVGNLKSAVSSPKKSVTSQKEHQTFNREPSMSPPNIFQASNGVTNVGKISEFSSQQYMPRNEMNYLEPLSKFKEQRQQSTPDLMRKGTQSAKQLSPANSKQSNTQIQVFSPFGSSVNHKRSFSPAVGGGLNGRSRPPPINTGSSKQISVIKNQKISSGNLLGLRALQNPSVAVDKLGPVVELPQRKKKETLVEKVIEYPFLQKMTQQEMSDEEPTLQPQTVYQQIARTKTPTNQSFMRMTTSVNQWSKKNSPKKSFQEIRKNSVYQEPRSPLVRMMNPLILPQDNRSLSSGKKSSSFYHYGEKQKLISPRSQIDQKKQINTDSKTSFVSDNQSNKTSNLQSKTNRNDESIIAQNRTIFLQVPSIVIRDGADDDLQRLPVQIQEYIDNNKIGNNNIDSVQSKQTLNIPAFDFKIPVLSGRDFNRLELGNSQVFSSQLSMLTVPNQTYGGVASPHQQVAISKMNRPLVISPVALKRLASQDVQKQQPEQLVKYTANVIYTEQAPAKKDSKQDENTFTSVTQFIEKQQTEKEAEKRLKFQRKINRGRSQITDRRYGFAELLSNMNNAPKSPINILNQQNMPTIPKPQKDNKTVMTIVAPQSISEIKQNNVQSRQKLLEEIKIKFRTTVEEEIKRIDEFDGVFSTNSNGIGSNLPTSHIDGSRIESAQYQRELSNPSQQQQYQQVDQPRNVIDFQGDPILLNLVKFNQDMGLIALNVFEIFNMFDMVNQEAQNLAEKIDIMEDQSTIIQQRQENVEYSLNEIQNKLVRIKQLEKDIKSPLMGRQQVTEVKQHPIVAEQRNDIRY